MKVLIKYCKEEDVAMFRCPVCDTNGFIDGDLDYGLYAKCPCGYFEDLNSGESLPYSGKL